MTEAEWLSPHVSCRAMLYWVKRTRKSFAVRNRQFRLLAVAFARRRHGRDAGVERACELVERYVDGAASQAEFRDAQVRGDSHLNLAHTVLHHDAFLAAADSAAADFLAFDDPDTVALIRDVFGNPFRPVCFAPEWRTDTAVTLARQMYEAREFGAMPILADALQDAGCDSDDVLSHCRAAGATHVRGCWVCDLVWGKG